MNKRHCERLKGARQSRYWIASSLLLLAMTISSNTFAASEYRQVTSPDYLQKKKAAEEQQAQEQAAPAQQPKRQAAPKPEPIDPDAIDGIIRKMSTEQMFQQAAPKKVAEDKTHRYAPNHCDFEVTFPEPPYKSKRCPERDPQNLASNQGQCYELQSYTMVFEMSTTVDISVNCIPAKPGSTAGYSEGVMRSALQGMVDRNSVTDYSIDFREMEDYRFAGLSGSGHKGKSGKIYSSQIWVGPESVMTVEAELIGRSQPQADAMYRDILRSIRIKQDEPPEADEEEISPSAN